LVWQKNIINSRANFKTFPFAQYLRQAQILILEILHVFLWLIRLRRIAFLDLEQISVDFEIEHFETASLTK
ncbi:MAG: hypothetical protein U9R43_01675, partial [Thermodesulfobacteriota bacterium]|nr:hypothetical protein [Thermodesulfobacteriota bacterium]